MGKPNFLFASLCDNDFDITTALRYVEEHRECELTPEEYKMFIIHYMVYATSIRRINPHLYQTHDKLIQLREYFESRIKVTLLEDEPELDHDMASAVMHIPTRYIWSI